MTEANMTAEQRVRMFQVRPVNGGQWCICEPKDLVDMIDGGETETYQIRVVHLTAAEVEALPEFEGW